MTLCVSDDRSAFHLRGQTYKLLGPGASIPSFWELPISHYETIFDSPVTSACLIVWEWHRKCWSGPGEGVDNKTARQRLKQRQKVQTVISVSCTWIKKSNWFWDVSSNSAVHVNVRNLFVLPVVYERWYCVLATQCIYVFGVDLRTNSDYFPIQH